MLVASEEESEESEESDDDDDEEEQPTALIDLTYRFTDPPTPSPQMAMVIKF